MREKKYQEILNRYASVTDSSTGIQKKKMCAIYEDAKNCENENQIEYKIIRYE